MNNFVESIIQQEKENGQLELFSTPDLGKIGKTVCAFLNSDGGRIIIGADEEGNAVKLNALEDIYDTIRHLIYNAIIPQSLIGIRQERYQNETIILIEVIEGNKKPYSLNSKSYVRIGNMTVPASEEEMSVLIRTGRVDEYTWEKTPDLEAVLDDLDIEAVNYAISSANKMGREEKFTPDDPIGFLTHYQLFRNNQLNNAAIVLFANNPTYFLPQCRIRIIDFGKGKGGNRYENIFLIESNILKAYSDIQEYFRKNLPIISGFSEDNWKRNDEYKYPLKALDEAVINALIHRDYSDITGEVLIGIYEDRIEITNSGKLLLKNDELKRSHSSNPPNPVLTHIVFLCGIIEKVGRGTILINESFEERDLQSPTWSNKNGTVVLTLYSIPKRIELNKRMQFFLRDAKDGYFTREEYMNYFEEPLNERTARLDLQKMQEGGFVAKVGDGAKTEYRLTTKELPDIAG